MIRKALIVGIFSIGFLSPAGSVCQTIFTLLQRQQKQADEYFDAMLYLKAIPIYQNLLQKGADKKNTLRLAQSFFNSRQYEKAIEQYNTLVQSEELSADDLYRYAEAQSALQHYSIAIDYYNQGLKNDPDNELLLKKIWRLKNIQYLFEDTTQCSIRVLNFNTANSEISPAQFQDKLVFASTQHPSRIIENINIKTNLPFYQLYAVKKVAGVQRSVNTEFSDPQFFDKVFKTRFNIGPVAFYLNEKAAVYVASSEEASQTGERTLGLYFARLENSRWTQTGAYPFNSDAYSISDVTINESGTQLYFSSDMTGGIGMADIYVSNLVNGKWTKPKNVGEPMNTPKNEVFPYLHTSGVLYFSSDGHPGLGGLDIFKMPVVANPTDEPQNIGYPMNSSYDDFGISLDSLGGHGYLSSNRLQGGYDDDIFEFDMDLQVYPFTITGVIKVKDHAWSDPSTIQVWPNKRIALMDSQEDRVIVETITDADGNFSMAIPYFSKYFIQIIDETGVLHKASLEIQKQRGQATEHEIVIVKDIFKQNEE